MPLKIHPETGIHFQIMTVASNSNVLHWQTLRVVGNGPTDSAYEPNDCMRVIDSHTAGEPTRVIVSGGPELGSGTLRERVEQFRASFDGFRTAAVLEPRGYDAVVGALICEPDDDSCDEAVIFFNNRGYLNMCGHGTIGLAVTLHHLGRRPIGGFCLQTPTGRVQVQLLGPNSAAFTNVPCFRYRTGVTVQCEEFGEVRGDIAWGGNWFFVAESKVELDRQSIGHLRAVAKQVRQSLHAGGITGQDGGEIDHIKFFRPDPDVAMKGRSLVVCPGGEFDRSPCGTGTSALLACLAADGKVQPGQAWTQDSATGGRFIATYATGDDETIIPTITGDAFVCADSQLIRHPNDPYRDGHSVVPPW